MIDNAVINSARKCVFTSKSISMKESIVSCNVIVSTAVEYSNNESMIDNKRSDAQKLSVT